MPERVTLKEEIRQYVVAAVITATSAFGAIFGYQEINPPRPYPYTSIDAGKDQENLREMILDLRSEIHRLEVNQDEMLKQIHKMSLKVSQLPPKEWQDRIRDIELCQARTTPDCHTGQRSK